MARKDRTAEVAQARAALIMAAMRRTIVTYGELGKAIGIEGVGVFYELRHVLDDLSDDCINRGEPSLAALIVNKDTGAPGSGWTDGARPWHTEVQKVFQYWAS